MLLSLNGFLDIFAAYINTIMIANFLDLGTEITRKYAEHPAVKLLFLYTFAYSVIPRKMPCLIAVALFFVIEVHNFISDAISTIKNNEDG